MDSFKSNLQSNLAMLGFINKLSHDYVNQLKVSPVSESSTHPLQNQVFFPLTSRPWEYGHKPTLEPSHKHSCQHISGQGLPGPKSPLYTFAKKLCDDIHFLGLLLAFPACSQTSRKPCIHKELSFTSKTFLCAFFGLFVLFCFSVGEFLQIVTQPCETVTSCRPQQRAAHKLKHRRDKTPC